MGRTVIKDSMFPELVELYNTEVIIPLSESTLVAIQSTLTAHESSYTIPRIRAR